jgi:hypothetical protein
MTGLMSRGARDLARSLQNTIFAEDEEQEILEARRSPAEAAKVNGGHELGPNLRATNQEIQHEDCSYRR